MTKIRPCFLVASILIFCAASASAEDTTCAKPLHIAYFDWQPYHYRDTSNTPTGLDIEILRATFHAAGCDFILQVMPWKRTLLAIKFGTIDGALGASSMPEREDYAWFSKPYRRETMVMFMRKEDVASNAVRTVQDVVAGDYRIGVLLGSWYGAEFAELSRRTPQIRDRMLQTAEYETLFTWLEKKRVDVVFNDLFNGVQIAKNMDMMDRVAILPGVLNDDYIHFILSKLTVSKDTVAAIDRAISEFQSTEAYTDILRKYVPLEQLQYLPVD